MTQNVCFVTMQSFNGGSLGSKKHGKGRVCSSAAHGYNYKNAKKPLIREKLVAEREFNNAMVKYLVKVVKGNETVDQLPRKFSRIAWHFLACSEKM